MFNNGSYHQKMDKSLISIAGVHKIHPWLPAVFLNSFWKVWQFFVYIFHDLYVCYLLIGHLLYTVSLAPTICRFSVLLNWGGIFHEGSVRIDLEISDKDDLLKSYNSNINRMVKMI